MSRPLLRTSLLASAGLACAALLPACSHRPPVGRAETAPAKPPTAPSVPVPVDEANAAEQTRPTQNAWSEVFPHVRADLRAGIVEFDARVTPLLIPDSQAPLFYLEVLVCTPDTREHETLLVTDARPSHIHAALLAIGLQHGKPGGWRIEPTALGPDRFTLIPVEPTGDPIAVRFVLGDAGAAEREIDPLLWIVRAADVMADSPSPRTLRDHFRGDGTAVTHVFAGSVLARRRPEQPESYDADGTGQIVGLHTFGSEVIALTALMNPDANTEIPEWVADLRPGVIPPPGTRVRVRLSRSPAPN